MIRMNMDNATADLAAGEIYRTRCNLWRRGCSSAWRVRSSLLPERSTFVSVGAGERGWRVLKRAQANLPKSDSICRTDKNKADH